MAAKQDAYHCTECGWTTVRWVGRCGECQVWGSVVERGAPKLTSIASSVPSSKAVPIHKVPPEGTTRRLTGIGELDRVLGGGLVPGVVALLAGEPGVGKSTLLLEVAAKWASHGERTLYVTGEESAAQVKLRATRTGTLADELYLAAETDLSTVLGHIEEVAPTLVVIDSVQTIGAAEADGSPGGVTQVREVTAALVRVAKRRGMAVIVVGHVTKDGSIAGPRFMEHLVDVVLTFEGDRHSGFRMVRATKNRYGPADEVGCFEMSETGIIEVSDPSGLFTSHHTEPVPGSCITVTMEGRRPLLAEIQALVAPSASQTSPRRTTNGIDGPRIAMVLAVLERKAQLALSQKDVYVSTVGGARVTDPAVDLAAAIAIASAALDRHFPQRLLALGEVGLAGELRRVPGVERRLAEAARLGFELALVPTGSRDVTQKVPRLGKLRVVEVATLAEALAVLDLRRVRGGETASGAGQD
ncbi:MAG TPA: DNA repair protein RadA [Propionibacteriaceae bacterium]|nr:DNA repair protein RadA [Propionibacteriaceae bacterium]